MYRASLESLLLASALLLSGAPSASAQDASPTRESRPRAAERLRPVGPVTVTATSVDWAKNGMMIYTGDVVMISKTLELRGARMELRQAGGKKAPFEITLTGSPATMKHLGATAQDPEVNGRGSKLVYRSATQTIDLSGQAHLERGKDELNGEQVRYDVAARRVQASGGDMGQVRIVIDVPEQP